MTQNITILKENDKIYYTIPNIKIISTKYAKIYIEILTFLDIIQEEDNEYNDNIQHLKNLCKTSIYKNKTSYNLSIKINNDNICNDNKTLTKNDLEKNCVYSCIIEEYIYTYNNEEKTGLIINVIKKVSTPSACGPFIPTINYNQTLKNLILSTSTPSA